jgi:hypothetical protein
VTRPRHRGQIETLAFSLAIAGTLAISGAVDAQAIGHPASAPSFAIEAGGGIVGSGIGVAVGIAISGVNRCPVEDDVVCIFKRLGVAAGIAAATSAAGTYSAGRMGDTRPSAPGAIIGSVAGVAAGLGVLRLIDEGTAKPGRVGSAIVFAVSHGIVTAVGSRVGATIRN